MAQPCLLLSQSCRQDMALEKAKSGGGMRPSERRAQQAMQDGTSLTHGGADGFENFGGRQNRWAPLALLVLQVAQPGLHSQGSRAHVRYVHQGQSKGACPNLSLVTLICAKPAGVGVTMEAAPMAHLQSLLGKFAGVEAD